MTTLEKNRKEREWLRTKCFAITASLKKKLDDSALAEREKRRLCAVQSAVLCQMAYQETPEPDVHRGLFQNPCGSFYLDYVARLIGWNQLDGGGSYLNAEDGYPKSYWVPKPALDSGYLAVRFIGERAPRIKRQTTAPDKVAQYALSCMQRLRTPVELVLPADPVRECSIRDHFIGIFFGDFQVRFGGEGRRLYHRIIEMPKEGRRNLEFCEPLVDFDVRTCVPVLLLSQFSDPDERKRYREILDGDFYTRLEDETGMRLGRKLLKKEFAKVLNAKKRNQQWLRQHPIFCYFRKEFPQFSQEVLVPRPDLARYFQRLESSIMIQSLGDWCRQLGAYWIPQHDGFLSTLEHGKEIEKRAVQIFEEKIGYTVRFKRTPLPELEP